MRMPRVVSPDDRSGLISMAPPRTRRGFFVPAVRLRPDGGAIPVPTGAWGTAPIAPAAQRARYASSNRSMGHQGAARRPRPTRVGHAAIPVPTGAWSIDRSWAGCGARSKSDIVPSVPDIGPLPLLIYITSHARGTLRAKPGTLGTLPNF